MKITKCGICGSTDISVMVGLNPNSPISIQEYCHDDETITERGWCNRCIDQVKLETTDECENLLRCEDCGSLNIEQKIWTNANAGKATSVDCVGRHDCWCQECEEHTNQIFENELLEDIQNWWNQTDFKTMELISGLRQKDFDYNDGYQNFIDACTKWWNEQTIDFKIEMWNENK